MKYLCNGSRSKLFCNSGYIKLDHFAPLLAKTDDWQSQSSGFSRLCEKRSLGATKQSRFGGRLAPLIVPAVLIYNLKFIIYNFSPFPIYQHFTSCLRWGLSYILIVVSGKNPRLYFVVQRIINYQ